VVALTAGTGSAFDDSKLTEIDREIRAAIGRGEIPGAVFRLERPGEVYEKAYGRRAIKPAEELMTPDTVFDAASLTKVIATAPSICLLADRQQLDLDDPVVKHLPEFAPKPALRPLFRNKFDTSADTVKNRARVTIRQMLTHTSGLPPSISTRSEPWWGHENGVRRCLTTPLITTPGKKFRYSDVNYILLGEIVRRVSGLRLNDFAASEIFAPLEMSDTGFLPGDGRLDRIAPTEEFPAYGILRGEVHDPTSRRMEGVAGHAGLFTTAADVSRFARSFLDPDSRVFSPKMTAEMIRTHTSKALGARGLGWDINSPYSYQRGENFPIGGFGHTGWTGTSVWADPGTKTTVVLMANRNHATEKGRIKQLRIKVATLAAEAVGLTRKQAAFRSNPVESTIQPSSIAMRGAAGDPPVLNGIDTLAAENFAPLRGLTVGLITNHTGVDRKKRSTIDLLHQADAVKLKVLFAPEHGIRGKLDQARIDDSVDSQTGLPIYSLYKSKSRKPTTAQLAGLDALVFDIQDIGCRFYTYISTMGKAMEAAADHDLKFIVLDRVNPIGGVLVDGPVRIGESKFTAYHDIPVQHGMTVGELAAMFTAEKNLRLDLTVIPLRGWSRAMRFDETGLPWINPSPNMRNLTEAILYPGIGLLEFCKLSVGRGTNWPFEVIGAPYIDGKELAAELSKAKLPGIRFRPVTFTPDASVFSGEKCGGVDLKLTDRDAFQPVNTGLAIARTLELLYPDAFDLEEKFNTLLMHPPTLAAVADEKSLSEIRQLWEPELTSFRERRAAFLNY